MELPAHIVSEMQRTKSYYPYRIVFAAFENETWCVYAKTTNHVLNNLLRKGITIWKI